MFPTQAQTKAILEDSTKTVIGSIKEAMRHGLVIQRIIGRLQRFGLNLNPYYLFREGDGVEQMRWPALADEFPSSVLDPEYLPALADCTEWATVGRLQDRLDKGHLCIVILHQGQIAGYTWADFDEVNDAACDFSLGPGEAYLYDAFVAPAHRGLGLAPYLRCESYKHLRRAGRTTFYSISDYFNSPAIRFKQKLNAEVVRLYLQIKLGDKQVGQWVLKNYR